ncbi:MAG: 3-dehydroquinate synthase [Candidatus Lightella neohaematopini]|nr:3-dehydroquinate synthase [Candidatus Lightella neohaematopini]
MKKLLKYNSCNILISDNLFNELDYNFNILKDKKILIITNKLIASLYLNKLKKLFYSVTNYLEHIIIPDGEKYKTMTTVNNVILILLKKNYDSNSIIISFGGGVISDISGFIASIYKRGISIIHIPTTLLAQVDACIGNKNSINHKYGKNMIGTFYEPKLIIIGLNFLNTLSKKEIYSGLSEIIKYSIIMDKNFFFWIEKNLKNLISLKLKFLYQCVITCCKLKINIINKNKIDNISRILLNLGHTFGHAIEKYTNYNYWSHGSAVAVGIIIATYISLNLNIIKVEYAKLIRSLIIKAKLPILGPKNINVNDYINIIKHDKKNNMNGINLVLPISIGTAKIFYNVDKKIIIKSILDSKQDLLSKL